MNIEEFNQKLKENADTFKNNMEQIAPDENQNYPDWHRMFTRWCEVGTEMESEYYPTHHS
jgi:hypothetical protein